MKLSWPQTVIACAAIVALTVAVYHGNVSGDAYIATIGLVLGSSLGYVNGKKAQARTDDELEAVVKARVAELVVQGSPAAAAAGRAAAGERE